MTSETVLAIESAISGGSIALLDGGNVIDKWHSAEAVSRSEELLPRIADLLERSGTKLRDLSRIAVSNGPGSYTGIRIGLATAMGMARALRIPCVGLSLLLAVAENSESCGEKIIVVPIGRNGYCGQRFANASDVKDATAAVSGDLNQLAVYIKEFPNSTIIAQTDAFQDMLGARPPVVGPGRIVDFGRDLAVAIGLSSATVDDGLQPFYARDIPILPGRGVSS
jgi:tRNA threonylcarbamoyl adenosine modification protein YeaZ